MRIPIVLDALGVIAAASPATQLMEVLKGAVGRQVRKNPLHHELALKLVTSKRILLIKLTKVGDVAAAMISELKSTGSLSAPQVFHFLPPGPVSQIQESILKFQL